MSIFGYSHGGRRRAPALIWVIVICATLIMKWNSPSNLYIRHINAGNKYYAGSQYDMAITEYNAALSARPNGYNALLVRGMAYFNLSQYRKAIADDTAALTTANTMSDFSSAYYNRGLCYERLKDYPQAINDYTEALRKTPNNRDALINRADCFRMTGNAAGTVNDIDLYLKVYPPTYFAYDLRGDAHVHMKQWKDAVADLTCAVKINMSDGWGWGNLGWAQYMCGDVTPAIASDIKAVQLRPNMSAARFNLALCYAVRNNWQLAETTYKKAIQHANQADVKGALQDIEDGLHKMPDSQALAEARKLVESAQK